MKTFFDDIKEIVQKLRELRKEYADNHPRYIGKRNYYLMNHPKYGRFFREFLHYVKFVTHPSWIWTNIKTEYHWRMGHYNIHEPMYYDEVGRPVYSVIEMDDFTREQWSHDPN